MSRYPQEPSKGKAKPSRQQFADGSAVVTYPDGGMLIVESDLARGSVLEESQAVKYSEPPPAPNETLIMIR